MYRRCLKPGKTDRRSSNGLHLTSTDLNPCPVGVGSVDFAPTGGDGGVQTSNAKPGLVARKASSLKGCTTTTRPSRAVRTFTDDSILKRNLEIISSPLESLPTADTMEDSKSHINPTSRLFKVNYSADWVNDFKTEQATLVHNIRPSLVDEKADSDRKLLGLGARHFQPQPQAYTAPLHEKTHELHPVHRPSTIRMFSTNSADWLHVVEALGPMRPSLFAEMENSDSGRNLLGLGAPLPQAASTKSSAKISSSSTAKKPSKKKTKKRIIDENAVCVPTDDDVLFGRGGFANKHPGNIRFRKTALELRRVYERSPSKEEKYHISQILVESVTSEGGRFLEKGKDGEWHPVIGGIRKKASQALRERIKEDSPLSSLNSRLTKVKSVNSQSVDDSLLQSLRNTSN
jgi:hypothetical protein